MRAFLVKSERTALVPKIHFVFGYNFNHWDDLERIKCTIYLENFDSTSSFLEKVLRTTFVRIFRKTCRGKTTRLLKSQELVTWHAPGCTPLCYGNKCCWLDLQLRVYSFMLCEQVLLSGFAIEMEFPSVRATGGFVLHEQCLRLCCVLLSFRPWPW